MLLAALSSAQMAGLACMAAAFIIFALVSSFVIPRRWPNFPGRFLWVYVGVVACFFVGMMLVVVFVGREQSEAKAGESTTSTTSAAPPPASAPAPAGNAAAGKALFAANGCAACHTFTPASATGTVGPDLDHLAANAKTANRGSLDQYTTESIVDPNAYVVPSFSPGIMPQDFGTKLSKSQVADLVAFLTKPQ